MERRLIGSKESAECPYVASRPSSRQRSRRLPGIQSFVLSHKRFPETLSPGIAIPPVRAIPPTTCLFRVSLPVVRFDHDISKTSFPAARRTSSAVPTESIPRRLLQAIAPPTGPITQLLSILAKVGPILTDSSSVLYLEFGTALLAEEQ